MSQLTSILKEVYSSEVMKILEQDNYLTAEKVYEVRVSQLEIAELGNKVKELVLQKVVDSIVPMIEQEVMEQLDTAAISKAIEAKILERAEEATKKSDKIQAVRDKLAELQAQRDAQRKQQEAYEHWQATPSLKVWEEGDDIRKYYDQHWDAALKVPTGSVTSQIVRKLKGF